MVELCTRNSPGENFDVTTYEYQDIDLERAVKRLPGRLPTVVTLHLMGHTQTKIGQFFGVSRSMVSKMMTKAKAKLRNALRE